MNQRDLLRFLRAVYPGASAADFLRADPAAVILEATELLNDQRKRLVDIDTALATPSTSAELTLNVRSVLNRDGPVIRNRQPLPRKLALIQRGQCLYWKHSSYGYSGLIPVVCVQIDAGRNKPIEVSFTAWPLTPQEARKTAWVSPRQLKPRPDLAQPPPPFAIGDSLHWRPTNSRPFGYPRRTNVVIPATCIAIDRLLPRPVKILFIAWPNTPGARIKTLWVASAQLARHATANAISRPTGLASESPSQDLHTARQASY